MNKPRPNVLVIYQGNFVHFLKAWNTLKSE